MLENLEDTADLGLSQAESGGCIQERQELLHQVGDPEELLHSVLFVIRHVLGCAFRALASHIRLVCWRIVIELPVLLQACRELSEQLYAQRKEQSDSVPTSNEPCLNLEAEMSMKVPDNYWDISDLI